MPQFSRPVIKQLDGIGSVIFRKHRRARRVKIRLDDQQNVVVTVPWRLRYEEAEVFVCESKSWIEQQRQRINTRIEQYRQILAGKELPGKKEAGAVLKVRLTELAEAHGFKYGKVSIRNQSSRWGSCNTRNDISLNYKLAWLPDHLRDYVLLHELVHTVHKNHGKQFWSELSRRYPEAEKCRSELRTISPSLLQV